MLGIFRKISIGYGLLLATALLILPDVEAIATAGSIRRPQKKQQYGVGDLIAHGQRIKFAADHGVANPVELAAAVKHSPMANLLLSVAIEESRGNPVAVGSSGELGAWQVKASDWGSVPKDICGQAGQAERIIRGLLIHTNGNWKKALARYNGGARPPGKSYRYAERILKRARHLQVAVKHMPADFSILGQALLEIPGDALMLKLTCHPLEIQHA